MAANLGYLFWREYYKDYFLEKPYEEIAGENDKDFEKRQKNYFNSKNTALFNASKHVENASIKVVGEDTELRFTTTYPGLLIGSGYSFGTGTKKGNEFKLGFYFDFTTGMPVIPGSSVKGLLRSVFPKFNEKEVKYNFDANARDVNGSEVFVDENKITEKTDLILKKEKALFTWWMVFQEEKRNLTDIEMKKLFNLEQAIFESKDQEGKPISIYQRDIFHDAYIIASHHSDEKVLGSDFITPHKHESNPALDPFTNPVPVMFLKVLPRVEFQFCLDLKDDNTKDQGFDAAAKKNLFRRIIQTMGAVAKTNVGYGKFISTLNHASENDNLDNISEKEKQPINFKDLIKVNVKLEAKVITVDTAEIVQNGTSKLIKTSKHNFNPGTIINITIIEYNKKTNTILMARVDSPKKYSN